MFAAQTVEQVKIRKWLEAQVQPDQLRAVEVLTRNAVRITDRYAETALVICRQDGSIEIMDDVDAC